MDVMKMRVWTGAVVAGLLAVPGLAFAASVGEVVDKYLEATGGRAAHEAVTSAVVEADATLPAMGMDMKISIYYEGGNYKQVVAIPDFGELVDGLTGDVAWTLNPMTGDSILEGAAAESVKNTAAINPFLDWDTRYASAKVTGEEAGATVVVFTSADGSETTCHFDNESGFLTRQEGVDSSGGDSVTTPSDYKKVGDILVAHSQLLETMNGEIEVMITSFDVNADVEDGTFDLPEVIVAMQEPAGVTAEGVMAMMDADGDGMITMEEAPEQLKGAFGMVDSNADGGIDVGEAQMIADFMSN